MPTPSVRMPPTLHPPPTGDPTLNAALGAIYAELEGGPAADRAPIRGRGAELVDCLVPELFDVGEVVWDDEAVDALPASQRAALRRDAEAQYSQVYRRKQWQAVLLRELSMCTAGRARMRTVLPTLALEHSDSVLLALLTDGMPDDLRAVAAFSPASLGHPRGVFGAFAELSLDLTWGHRYFDATKTPISEVACALIALERLLPPAERPDPRWKEVALRVLGDHGFAQFGKAILRRFPPDEALLEALLATPPQTADHTELLARHDDPRAMARYAPFCAHSSLADTPVLAALAESRHTDAAHAAFDVVAALAAHHAPASRSKRFKALAKELGAKFGVKAPKLPKATPPPPPVVAEAPAAHKPTLPPASEIEAALRAAFDAAGLAERFDQLASPAAALVTERADEASIPVGASRLGGRPDLPAGATWPVVKKSPLTFVGQIDLADLASFGSARWSALPPTGLLSFFVHDANPEDYARKGAVVLTPAGTPLVRLEVPAAFGTTGRAPAPACRVVLIETWRLIHPSHRVVTHQLPYDAIRAFEALRPTFDQPLFSTLLGHRDRYDGEVKRGYRLLLQVTSDPQAAFHWGDEEELAFFVSEKALAAHDFSGADVRVGD